MVRPQPCVEKLASVMLGKTQYRKPGRRRMSLSVLLCARYVDVLNHAACLSVLSWFCHSGLAIVLCC